MSRLCPTADTAWSVPRSVGRAPPRPSAGSPAAIAPDVTITTRGRWPRRPGPSAHSLSTVSSEFSRGSSVTEAVPIFTTTIPGGSQVFLVLEREPADVHEVALPRAGAGERPVDAEPLEP